MTRTDFGDTALHALTDCASAMLGVPLSLVGPLGGSRRSTVVRCTRPGGDTVVVKQVHDDGTEARERFVREVVGLGVLDGVPRALTRDDDARVIVMEDLGDGPTLADLLLAGDRDTAWEGTRAWARALGVMLGRSAGRLGDAREKFAAVGVDVRWPARHVVTHGLCLLTGRDPDDVVDGDAGLADELARLEAVLRPSAADVLSPTDTCPDNAILTRGGWRFLDLEGTSVQHVALDAAYTLLPFATCWCVYDPPPGLTDDLIVAFRAGLDEAAPALADSPTWDDDVDAACAGWILAATGWMDRGAQAGDPHVGFTDQAPPYRELLVNRWRWGAAHLGHTFPRLAEMFTEAAERADAAWDSPRLAGYPAFASSRVVGESFRRASGPDLRADLDAYVDQEIDPRA
ncbi:hypothetical protein [Isoptericola croceus]|uniref:hypothetical protein n=1 Tax=Isoptericola croceus TaxID=3031406 RepID=UPI0023F8E466|nr:hypothetical protein [Isoptericola croceus]